MFYLRENIENNFNAGSKARIDVEEILKDMKYKEINYCTGGKRRYVIEAFNRKRELKKLQKNDIVVMQYPYYELSFEAIRKRINELKKNNVKVIAIIHDLLSMRSNEIEYLINEEIKTLNLYDGIIVHNQKMNQYLVNNGLNISASLLEIFDYIDNKKVEISKDYKNVSIAGNLSEKKSKYIYIEKFNEINTNIQLYGPNFDEKTKYKDNIKFRGCFSPKMLGDEIKCGFGLVWDGESIDSCSGPIGEYLKYNNPHKTSMYLSLGIPIIVWKQAAIAEFILKNKLGIVVNSLEEIDENIEKISFEQYEKIKKNCEMMSLKLQKGYFLKKALNQLIEKI